MGHVGLKGIDCYISLDYKVGNTWIKLDIFDILTRSTPKKIQRQGKATESKSDCHGNPLIIVISTGSILNNTILKYVWNTTFETNVV